MSLVYACAKARGRGRQASAATMSLSKLSTTATPDIPEKPHQPLSLVFPKREFGKKQIVKRSFQATWFKQHQWLHYDEERDLAFCHTCIKAYREKKLTSAHNVDPSFILRGYYNWKDATVKLKAHEASKCHQEALLKIFTLPSTTRDIGETLSSQHRQEKLDNRCCFLTILSNTRFLAHQGLPLRGDGTEADSNFIQLFHLRGEDNPNYLNG